jgi:hypothetical protein
VVVQDSHFGDRNILFLYVERPPSACGDCHSAGAAWSKAGLAARSAEELADLPVISARAIAAEATPATVREVTLESEGRD